MTAKHVQQHVWTLGRRGRAHVPRRLDPGVACCSVGVSLKGLPTAKRGALKCLTCDRIAGAAEGDRCIGLCACRACVTERARAAA